VLVVARTQGEEVELDGPYEAKSGFAIHSGPLDGLATKQAMARATEMLVAQGAGGKRVTYRLRDAIFSRQRYWGEPIPIYFREGVPTPMSPDVLPLELPEVDAYRPTADGEPPLARAAHWCTEEGYPIETSTMPGFAGSSAYYLRFMDPRNAEAAGAYASGTMDGVVAWVVWQAEAVLAGVQEAQRLCRAVQAGTWRAG